MNDQATLFLLPNLLYNHQYAEIFLPLSVFKAMETIDGLIAESEREGRHYLKHFETKRAALEIPIALFNEHTPDDHLDFLLEPIFMKHESWGIVSDAGLPCIADPGSKLVLRARQKGIRIQAFVGPSSIILALMLSGLPGQKFFFHGYLHRDMIKRKTQIKELISQSRQEGITQLFIEAPYRNQTTLNTLLELLPNQTLLSVAWDLTLPSQGIITQLVSQWKKCTLPHIDKKPAIFLFHANTIFGE